MSSPSADQARCAAASNAGDRTAQQTARASSAGVRDASRERVTTTSSTARLHSATQMHGASCAHDRQAAYDAARSVCVLALLDSLDGEPVAGTGPALALNFAATAPAECLAVLLEPSDARDAHAIVSALARAGVVQPTTAQRVHLLIDLRGDSG